MHGVAFRLGVIERCPLRIHGSFTLFFCPFYYFFSYLPQYVIRTVFWHIMILSDLNNTRYIGYVVSALYLLGIHGQKIGLQILSDSCLQNKHEYITCVENTANYKIHFNTRTIIEIGNVDVGARFSAKTLDESHARSATPVPQLIIHRNVRALFIYLYIDSNNNVNIVSVVIIIFYCLADTTTSRQRWLLGHGFFFLSLCAYKTFYYRIM